MPQTWRTIARKNSEDGKYPYKSSISKTKLSAVSKLIRFIILTMPCKNDERKKQAAWMRGSWAQESSVRLIRWAAPTKMNRNILISEEYTVIRTHCPPIWACMKSLISKSKNLEISIIFFIFISKKKKKDKTFKNFRRNWPSQFQCDPSNMVIKANAILTKIRKILNCNHISYIFILKKILWRRSKVFLM